VRSATALNSAPVGHRPDGCRALGRVVGSKPLGSQRWLTVEVPGWRGARSGQFCLLQPEPSRCFLARAFSVADQVGERVSFLVAPVGEGTRELGDLAAGERVWVLGPLGNGFDMGQLSAGSGRLLMVAGGVGVAPFPLLMSQLAESYDAVAASTRPEIVVLLGFRDTAQSLARGPIDDLVPRLQQAGLPCRVEVGAEDGSLGRARKVTDLLSRELQPGDRVAVCGAWAMSKAVWDVCSPVPGIRVWFSLEAGMACGVGSCHGCVITLADGSQARVCHDGPVFSGEQVLGSVKAGPNDKGGQV